MEFKHTFPHFSSDVDNFPLNSSAKMMLCTELYTIYIQRLGHANGQSLQMTQPALWANSHMSVIVILLGSAETGAI